MRGSSGGCMSLFVTLIGKDRRSRMEGALAALCGPVRQAEQMSRALFLELLSAASLRFVEPLAAFGTLLREPGDCS